MLISQEGPHFWTRLRAKVLSEKSTEQQRNWWCSIVGVSQHRTVIIVQGLVSETVGKEELILRDKHCGPLCLWTMSQLTCSSVWGSQQIRINSF